MPDPYASVEDYIAQYDAGDDDPALLLDQLKAVSNWISAETHQFFGSETQTRTYIVPFTSDTLHIDNASAVTSVIIDADNDYAFLDTPTTAYDLARDGNLNAALNGVPYNEIRLRSAYFSANQLVRVAGTFGWAAVPSEIKQATLELTAILRIQSPRATVSVDQIGTVTSMSPQARNLVDRFIAPFKRVVIA